MADHMHEPYDVYGTAATVGDISRLEGLVAGLRHDLGVAESYIRDLDERYEKAIRKLSDRIDIMGGGHG